MRSPVALLLLLISFAAQPSVAAQDSSAPPGQAPANQEGRSGVDQQAPAPPATNAAPAPATPDPTQDQSAEKQELQSKSFRHFHQDLWRNFGGLFSEENAIPALIGFGSAGIVASKDDEVAAYFLRRERAPAVGRIGGVLGHTAFIIAGGGTAFLIGQARQDARFREITYSLGQALAMEGIILYPLKVATDRQRPNGQDRRSFPSGHATSAFAVAAVLDHYYGPKVAIPVYATGAFVGFARIEQNKHFLTDVLAGSTLGWIIGKTVTRESEAPPRWTPTVSSDRHSASVGVRINLER